MTNINEAFEQYEEDIVEEEVIDVKTLESWKVDKYISEVIENDAQIKKLEEIAKKRKEEIDLKLKQQKETIEKRNGYLKTTLAQYAQEQPDLKKTKTKFTLKLLSGQIEIPRSKTDFVEPKDEEVVKQILNDYPELDKTKPAVQWGELKKKLILQGDKVYDRETGEDLSHLIKTEEKLGEVKVK
jgi:Bacteriophage Mu Gam like protein